MEFLETLETIRQESASIQTIFGREGQRAPSRSRTPTPAYLARLNEAVQFVGDVLDGSRPAHHLSEAMTTSDFPILFGDILDRQVLSAYREAFPTWTDVAKRRTVRDFRGVKLFKPLTGAAGRLDSIDELGEYPEYVLGEQATQTITVAKFGRRMAFSWEASVNDDLQMLTDMPTRMGRAAVRTENFKATSLYVGTAGPLASLYSAGNKNIVNTGNGAVTNNPALSITGLADALTVFGNQVNEDGDPIEHDAVTLVVPPALEVTANNILNATSLEMTTLGGIPALVNTTATPSNSGEIRLLTANWLSKKVKLVVNPLIPIIASTNKNTSWFLFGNPNTDREALVMAFLRGWEQPAVFIKSPNARRVGSGSEIDPMDGDFDTDAITYKIRHVLGTATVDPKATVASNGTGS